MNIINYSNNEIMSIFFSFLRKSLNEYVKVALNEEDFLKEGFIHHNKIFKAIKNKNKEEALKILKLHLDRSNEALKKYFKDNKKLSD